MKYYTKKSISKNETKKTKKSITQVLTDKEFYNLEYLQQKVSVIP